MREDNDGMDVITRTEFDDAMKNLMTKEDLQAALAATKQDLQAALADTKSDILDGIDQRLTKALLDEREHTTRLITEAKHEILSVTRKDIADAIAPLNSRLDRVDGRLDQMGGRLDQMDSRFDGIDEELRKLGEGQVAIAKNVDTIAQFAQLVLDEHENRLKDAKL